MTKQEAIKFLTNKKVFVKNKSKEIQEKLFSLGIYWRGRTVIVQYEDKPFLYLIFNDHKNIVEISYGSKTNLFYEHKCEEIAAEDILNITIDEPTYRPFKDAKECWYEMLKHEPFGWIKRKDENYWFTLVNIGDDRDFKSLLSKYKFADGIPFGIKED